MFYAQKYQLYKQRFLKWPYGPHSANDFTSHVLLILLIFEMNNFLFTFVPRLFSLLVV